MKKSQRFKAIIFDLDGTLLDTAPDLIASCNATLEHFGFQAISPELAHTKLTAGMREMVKLGIPASEQPKVDVMAMRKFFAQYYLDHICDYTKPFEGMPELLKDLINEKIHLAVVTNKYADMTHKLLKNFDFYQDLNPILGCDSVINCKPHPEPILKVLESLQVAPFDALYVGDHLNDIMAANRAKTHSAVALWGYGAKECGNPQEWSAHYLLEDINALRQLVLEK